VLSYNRSAQIGVAHNVGGRFAPPTLYASGKPAPRAVALADVDRDGKLDTLVLNVPSSTNAGDPEVDHGSVSVYRGAGDGTLGAPVSYATGGLALDFEVADLDGDDWPDVATAAFDGEGVAVLRGDGHGALLPRVITPVGTRMATLTAGDLDHDGDLDLVTGSFDNIWVFHNDGDAGFAVEGPYVIRNEELAVADATRDGVLDLVVAAAPSRIVPQEAGHLVAPVPVAVGGERVELADFDGDGRLDAVTGFDGVSLLRGRAGGSFAPPQSLAFSPQTKFESAVGDVDGDGHPDLVYGGGTALLTLRHNLGDGTFGPPVILPTESLDFNAAPALGDLDGDGDLDLAVAIGFRFPGSLQVYWNDGHGNFTLGPRMVTGGDSRTPAIARVTTLTGRPDILVPNWFDGTITVFQGHPDRTFSRFATLAAPAFAKTVVVRDVTQDGRADLVTAGPGPLFGIDFRVRIYPGTDHGLGAAIDLPAGTFPSTVVVTDLDSDGRPDIVVGGSHIAVHRALPGRWLRRPRPVRRGARRWPRGRRPRRRSPAGPGERRAHRAADRRAQPLPDTVAARRQGSHAAHGAAEMARKLGTAPDAAVGPRRLSHSP